MAMINVEVQRTIRRPVAIVSRQFGDIQHHSRNHVHPDINFTVLSEKGDICRFRQAVKLVGMLQTDEIVQRRNADGSLSWEVVEGANKGTNIYQSFTPVGSDATMDFSRRGSGDWNQARTQAPVRDRHQESRGKRPRGRSAGSGRTWLRNVILSIAALSAVPFAAT